MMAPALSGGMKTERTAHMDWTDWHEQYETSLILLARLRIVREQIRATLDECGPGPIRIVSICAGDGRDVIGALSDHPRRGDVTASLLDTHAPSLDRGRAAARAAGLERRLEFLCSDATLGASYRGIVPADLVIVSGVLGHQSNAGIRRFLENFPMLCKSGGSVIWNRHLVTNEGAKDVVEIREHLRRLDFEEAHFSVTSRNGFAVGRSRFRGAVDPFDPQREIFEFPGLDYMARPDLASGERVHWESEGAVASAPPGHDRGKPAQNVRSLRESDGAAASRSHVDVEQSLPSCFERQVVLHPHRTALGSGAWRPDYAQLNDAANRLAHALLAGGGSAGDRVALLMNHDTPLIAAMLAVLKAGRIVVVLNATDPAARLGKMLLDAGPSIILTDSTHRGLAVRIAGKGCSVVGVEDHLSGQPAPNPDIRISPDDIAFLIYTSGSTGPPKGVMQSHRNILHKALRLTRGMKLQAEDRVMFIAALSGGQGVSTTWSALANGAALCPFPIMTRGVTGLAAWMVAHDITVYVSAASVFRHFARTLDDATRFPSARLILLASEPAISEDFAAYQKHFPKDSILYHTLASSETGVIAQRHFSQDDRVPEGRLPVGEPVEDMEVLLLDETGRDVPRGGTGEIAVRSRYLFPGYWRDESLTAQRLSGTVEADGARTFRSGDRGRLTEDGLLVFMGRHDTRVNVHGFRVELSEIEDALSREPSVEKAAVCACPRPSGDVQLVAYIIVRPGHTGTSDVLRQAVRATLPGHMIPAVFVFLEAFPLTPHGKTDREALRKIIPAIPGRTSEEQPRTDTEKLVAAIWSEVFERGPLSGQDDFFDLGGDSLTAAVIAARIHAALFVQLDLRAFAEHPKLAALASAVDAMRAGFPSESAPPLGRVSREEALPLSFHEERVWRFSQTPGGSAGYTAAGRHLIRGPLDAGMLRESMGFLAGRHEMLRTAFPLVQGVPVRQVHPASRVPLSFLDLAGTADAEEEATRVFRAESLRPFDLALGPLQRFMLIRLRQDEHQLLRICHHIISDAWAWDVYFNELGLVYEAKLRGEPPPLPEFEPLQYGDYAAWQRRAMRPDGPAYRNAVLWWKELLAGLPQPLDLPFRRPERLPDVAADDAIMKLDFDPAVSQRLAEIGREQHVTVFAVRLAAFVALLAAETGQPDVVLGTYFTNRNRVETQKMFGFFANLVALRFGWDGALTFREWLSVVGGRLGEIQAQGEIPYEQLCAELRAQGVTPPEIRALLSSAESPASIRFGGLECTRMDKYKATMPWGFTLTFFEQTTRNQCGAAFDARIYDPAGVRAFVGRLLQFLDAASRHPERPLAGLLAEGARETPFTEESKE